MDARTGVQAIDAPVQYHPDRGAPVLQGPRIHHREVAAQIPEASRLRGGSVFSRFPDSRSLTLVLSLALLLSAPAQAATPAKSPAKAATDARSAASVPFFTGRPGAQQYRAQASRELREAQLAIARMLAAKGTRTLANTVMVFNEAMTHGENVAYQSHLLEAVHPDSSFRSAAETVTQSANKFLDDLSLRRDVYTRSRAS